MKSYILPVLFIFAVISSCMTVEPAQESSEGSASSEEVTVQEDGKKSEGTAQAKAEPEPIPVDRYRVTKETRYLANGILDLYTVFEYAGDVLTSEYTYFADGTTSEKVLHKYDGGNRAETVKLADDESVISGHKYTYDDSGNLVEDVLLDSQQKPVLSSAYEYDREGQKTKWIIYGESGSQLGYSEYHYIAGKNTEVENFNPAGEMQERLERTFDDRDRPIKVQVWNAEGKELERTETEYKNPGLTQTAFFMQTRKVESSELFYDEDGNLAKRIRYDRAGAIIEIVEYEYETVQ